MISWTITAVLVLLIARIVWVEVKFGRKVKGALATTNEQIEVIKQSATANYRAKFGRDPTGTFEIVEIPHAASKKS